MTRVSLMIRQITHLPRRTLQAQRPSQKTVPNKSEKDLLTICDRIFIIIIKAKPYYSDSKATREPTTMRVLGCVTITNVVESWENARQTSAFEENLGWEMMKK
jgi:hypothetical protein